MTDEMNNMQTPNENNFPKAQSAEPEDLTAINSFGTDEAEDALPAYRKMGPSGQEPFATPTRPPSESGWQSGPSAAGANWRQDSQAQGTYQNQSSPYYSQNANQTWQQSGYQPPAGYQNTPPSEPGTIQNYQQPQYQWNAGPQEPKMPPKKKRGRGKVVFAILICCVLGFAAISTVGIGVYNILTGQGGDSGNTSSFQEPLPPAIDASGIVLQDKPNVEPEVLPEGRLSTEQIVEKIQPSIVSITVYANTPYGYQAYGTASGIIIREDGYIVTNAHVLADAEGISIQLHDDEENGYEGRVVGVDSKTDLAVLRIDATGLTPASFGNSEQVKVGEKVIAIGTPQSMDFSGSVTQGIVSGLNRTIETSGTSYSQLIQTDAAINPGNSGGALVNEYGQVIGINSVKVVSSGQTYTEGMGFAIPASTIKPVVDDLIAYGHVTGRVKLGVTVSVVDSGLARLNGVPPGLLVQSTEAGSDISRQGVLPSDIITGINGKEIYSSKDLADELDGKQPGDKVELEIYRRASRSDQTGRFFTITVTLMEDRPSESAPVQTPVQTPQPSTDPSSLEDYLRDFFS